MALIRSRYGKSRVRVMRVARGDGPHRVSELELAVALQGGFDRSYTDADNAPVVATDSMRNLIYAVARARVSMETEPFCAAVAEEMLRRYPTIEAVSVQAVATPWARLDVEHAPHPHGFVPAGNGRPTAAITADRQGIAIRSGMQGLTMLKTGGSGFTGFLRDGFTTLPDTEDRLFATSLDADWSWRAAPPCYAAARDAAMAAMLRVFADTYSHSVQDSLYRMGLAALQAVPEIDRIDLSAPNKHYLPAPKTEDLGTDPESWVLVPTDEPHGQIDCTVGRDTHAV